MTDWTAEEERVAERFWSKVERLGPKDCWNWIGSRNHRGYGNFRVDGRTNKAHRVAYKLSSGESPKGKYVCHRCDNPPCCNPAHLFLGTHADNVADMMAKGRHVRPVRDETKVNYVRGSNSNFALLNEADVIDIRRRKKAGEMSVTLAREYNVHRTLIYKIITRRIWKHVA